MFTDSIFALLAPSFTVLRKSTSGGYFQHQSCRFQVLSKLRLVRVETNEDKFMHKLQGQLR